MIEWFKQLDDTQKLMLAGLVLTAGLAAIGGWFKYFRKKPSEKSGTQIKQEGKNNTAVVVEEANAPVVGEAKGPVVGEAKGPVVGEAKGPVVGEAKGPVVGEANAPVAGRDIHMGLPAETLLASQETAFVKLGAAQEKIRTLEEQLANPDKTLSPTGEETIQPSAEALASAQAITDEDSSYARALKAIAEGQNDQADDLLEESQEFLNTWQEEKDQAQIKVYVARMENATYSGRHIEALDWCEKLEPLAGDDEHLLKKMADAYYYNAQYNKAEPILKHLLVLEKERLGSEAPQVATRLNNLAQLYQHTNRLLEAEPLMERALAIDEKTLAEDHPKVAIRLSNLATLYLETNRLTEAEPLMIRALAIDEKTLGEDHPNLAIRLNNLAHLYQATDRLTEAEPLMIRVVDILENPEGESLPNYSGALNNLAQLYKATNRLTEAEPLIKRALTIDEKSLGEDHPDVARDLNNLAQLYKDTNRFAEAEPLQERALAIFEASLGADHPNTLTVQKNLMILRAAMEEPEE